MKFKVQLALFFCLALLIFIPGCRLTRDKCNQLYPPVVVHSVDTFLQVKETWLRDTTFLPADISGLEIYFEADSERRIEAKEITTFKGKRSALNYKLQPGNRSLKATFNCNCDSLSIYHLFKNLDTSVTVHSRETEINTVNVPAKLTWWQSTKVNFGGYALGLDFSVLLLVLLYLLWKIFKLVTPQGAVVQAAETGAGWLAKIFKRP